MSNGQRRERKSLHQLAFDHYLRTGEQLTNAEWLARYEQKFNPYHDERGRFSSPPGVTVSHGAGPARMSAMRSLDSWMRGGTKQPARPKATPPPPPPRIPNRTVPVRPAVRALLTQISNGEGTGDVAAKRRGLASGYEVTFGYGIYAKQDKPLTQMTLQEVDNLQTRILYHPENNFNASPVGRYQIVRKTLRELKVNLNLRDDMIFDENLQDRLAEVSLEKRGISKYLAGKISEREFHTEIANEWASVADPETGRPRKSGQHLGTTNAQISPLIRELRTK